MKSGMKDVDTYLEVLILALQDRDSLPFKIKTRKKCPTGRRLCNRHHGEIVIESYDPDSKLFTCIFHGVHDNRFNSSTYPAEQIKKTIRRYIIKKTMTLTTIRKKVDISKFVAKNKLIQFRVSEIELASIQKRADKKGLNVNEFARSVLLK